MPIFTLEGIIEHGQLKLTTPIPLPDQTKVSVLISDHQQKPRAHLVSPRLAHPEQAADFQMEVIEDPSDADV